MQLAVINQVVWLTLTGLLAWIEFVLAANRYYGEYTVYGTGDTILQTFHAHGGPKEGNRKWHMECLDGEAMIGIGDLNDDFQKMAQLWCKFMFPNKPPTNGLYPYYPNCFVRDYNFQFHCYDAKQHDASINSFITAMWDNDFQFWIFRGPPDTNQPYKCCKTPLGYHIDYLSCYYFPTKDIYGEYYDNTQMFLVFCATDYVMTGIGKKINPWSQDAHVDWIQCCRVGLGGAPLYRPPKHTYSYDSYANQSYPNKPSGQYAAQYQGRNLGAQMLPRGFVGTQVNSNEDTTANYQHRDYIPAPAMGGPMPLQPDNSEPGLDELY